MNAAFCGTRAVWHSEQDSSVGSEGEGGESTAGQGASQEVGGGKGRKGGRVSAEDKSTRGQN